MWCIFFFLIWSCIVLFLTYGAIVGQLCPWSVEFTPVLPTPHLAVVTYLSDLLLLLSISLGV